MNKADLHLHTTASDGLYSPHDLVKACKSFGLAAIAITDHDVTDGVEEACEIGAQVGLEVLAGVEINTDHGPTEVHVLGYCMDMRDEDFQRTMDWLREGRVTRAREMVHKLATLGCPLSWERVLEIAGPGAIGRPHLAQALIEAQHVRTRRQAFELYLGNDGPAYVPRERFDAFDAIRIIRKAGGVAVAAHPVKIRNDDLIPDLVSAGLGGLEAHHPDHSPEDAQRYQAMADDMGLVWTGGSDFHGHLERPLGAVVIPYAQVKALKVAAVPGTP